ncbi:CD151 antigen-like protein [Leptotrombidium deliense]|uniref:CD151 antigen-like protein n=1 Tax=Leptotrombidium deliense TaxID=299467 RepID=A0A443SI80_9ACAR|nr:CD151 antigen-like protein [Leptotrombidium deliense]
MYYAMILCSIVIFIVAILNLIYNCLHARKSKKEPRREECQEIDEMTLTFTNHAFSSFQRGKQLQKRKPYSSIALCIFIFALLFLFTFQLAISFVSLVFSIGGNGVQNSEAEFVRMIKENLNASMTNNEILMEQHEAFDAIQSTYKCCGLKSFEDYEFQVPDSCCKSISPNCSFRKHPSNIYYDGCINKTFAACNRHIIVLGSVAFGLSFIYVFGLVFAVCLFVQIMRVTN